MIRSDRNGDVVRAFGIEEEFLLLDPDTLMPVNAASRMIRALRPEGYQPDPEFFVSQIETATEVCHTMAEATESLTAFRAQASDVAADHGVMLVGVGLPPVGGDEAGVVTPKPRYQEIATNLRAAGAYQYVTGTHVHVEIPSREAGVDALGRVARWTPALLALTANSPMWCGELTGFESWRHMKGLSWPVVGYPYGIKDVATYDEAVRKLVSFGTILDPAMVTWLGRLSNKFPTVEFRLADAQLHAEDAVAYAAVLRALVDKAIKDFNSDVERPTYSPGAVDGALWVAARDGLSADLPDPLTGEVHGAFGLIEMMIDSVSAQLETAGDLDAVEQLIERRQRRGSPARQQQQRFEARGLAGLGDLYRDAMACV